MNAALGITRAIRSTFCEGLDVSPVPIGYAISTGFRLPDGDCLSFYAVEGGEGLFRLEDDGSTIPNAVAAGLDLKSSTRDGLLRGLLAEEGVHFDPSDMTLRTEPMTEEYLGDAATRFVSAMIRVRDLMLLNRENVAATFAEDVRNGLLRHLPKGLEIDRDVTSDLTNADIVLRDERTGLKKARIFAAGGDIRLLEAIVAHHDQKEGDSPLIAVVDRRRNGVSEKRFNVATNRGVPLAVVDGPGEEWVDRVYELANAANTHGPPASKAV